MKNDFRVGVVKWFGKKRLSKSGDNFGYIDAGDKDYYVHQDQLNFDPHRMLEGTPVLFVRGSRNSCMEVHLWDEYDDANARYQSILRSHKNMVEKLIRRIKLSFNQEEITNILINKYCSLDSSAQWSVVRELGTDIFWNNDVLRRQLSISTRVSFYLKLSEEARIKYLQEIFIDSQTSGDGYLLSNIPISEYINDRDIRRSAPIELQIKMLKATFDNKQLYGQVVEDFKFRLKRMNLPNELDRYNGGLDIDASLLFEAEVWKYLPVKVKVLSISRLDNDSKENYKRYIVSHVRELLYNGLPSELQLRLGDLGPEILLDNKTWSLFQPHVKFSLIGMFDCQEIMIRKIAKNKFLSVLNEIRDDINFKLLENIPSWLLVEEEVILALYGIGDASNLKSQQPSL